MSKLLTQEEIDALLATVKKDEVERSVKTDSRVQLYDFRHPERLSKEQLRTLRTIHDNFARLFATQLSTNLRTLVDVDLVSIDQVTFGEYGMAVSVPGAIYTLKMEAINGKGILELSPQFILFMVDRLLGGFGNTNIPAREVTIVEQNVIQRIINVLLNTLNETWAMVHPLGLKVESFESDPQFVQIARASDSLVVVFFEVRVRGINYQMNLALPYYTLEIVLSKLSAQTMMSLSAKTLEEGDSASIRERIAASKIPLKAVLANTTIRVGDFISLEPDDLLQLEKRISDPVEIIVAEKLKFFGAPGKIASRRAVQVARPVTPEEEIIYE